MILVGIDLETTCLDTSIAEIIEVGIATFDTNSKEIIESTGFLVKPSTIDIDPKITEITGLNIRLLKEHGYNFADVVPRIKHYNDKADFLVGHNAIAFDSVVLDKCVNRISIEPILQKPWIDTMIDVPYPSIIRTRSLTALCAEHGFLNPFPHRALFDVAAMFRLLTNYDINHIIEIAKTPIVWIRARVSYDARQKAKDEKFMWDPNNKFWVRQVREYNLKDIKAKCGFTVEELPGYAFKLLYSSSY